MYGHEVSSQTQHKDKCQNFYVISSLKSVKIKLPNGVVVEQPQSLKASPWAAGAACGDEGSRNVNTDIRLSDSSCVRTVQSVCHSWSLTYFCFSGGYKEENHRARGKIY